MLQMKKKDGRKLTHEQSEYIRTQAVRAVVKGQRSPEEVIETFGMHRSCIYRWLSDFKQGGWKALKSTKAEGKKPIIEKKEKNELKKLLVKNPTQLQFDFGLWTLEMVKELIKKRFNKTVSIWTVSRILYQIGFTKQKPLYRAYQQDPKKVELWLEKDYPSIVKESKKEKRDIFFEDEAGFRSTDNKGKTWGIKGQTPIVKVTGQRYSINSISAVNMKGVLRFMIYKGNFGSELFIEFLKRLLLNQKRSISLIVDGHRVHKSKKVKEFVASTKGKLKIYYLPPYSPELNPDEQVWNSAKSKLSKKTNKSASALDRMVTSIMHSIQKNVSLVKSFFGHPDVAYVM
jgi:transposase